MEKRPAYLPVMLNTDVQLNGIKTLCLDTVSSRSSAEPHADSRGYHHEVVLSLSPWCLRSYSVQPRRGRHTPYAQKCIGSSPARTAITQHTNNVVVQASHSACTTWYQTMITAPLPPTEWTRKKRGDKCRWNIYKIFLPLATKACIFLLLQGQNSVWL